MLRNVVGIKAIRQHVHRVRGVAVLFRSCLVNIACWTRQRCVGVKVLMLKATVPAAR